MELFPRTLSAQRSQASIFQLEECQAGMGSMAQIMQEWRWTQGTGAVMLLSMAMARKWIQGWEISARLGMLEAFS